MESPEIVPEREVGGEPPAPLVSEEIPSLRRTLLAFYDEEKRDLPWRDTDDPYAIWVSEIMAQQTRVDTVVPYYRAWLEAFPTVAALADADEDQVLKRWEGLGYYSRARNLHRAARLVCERFGGEVPESPEELRELPGVGPYTAGAVASIAFGVAAPAVDGNVKRVFARLFDDPEPPPARLTAWASTLVDPQRPGDFNQALMELGATVCTPRSPRCGACPVATHCRALAAGTVAHRPAPKKRRPVPHHHHVVLVAAWRSEASAGAEGSRRRDPGTGGSGRRRAEWRVLCERRPDDGLLAGMWAFPGAEVSSAPGLREDPEGDHDAECRGAALELAEERGLTTSGSTAVLRVEPVRHTFSHLVVTYHPYVVEVEGTEETGGARGTAGDASGGGGPAPDMEMDAPAAWIPARVPAALALPVAQQKILARVVRKLAAL